MPESPPGGVDDHARNAGNPKGFAVLTGLAPAGISTLAGAAQIDPQLTGILAAKVDRRGGNRVPGLVFSWLKKLRLSSILRGARTEYREHVSCINLEEDTHNAN